MYPSLRSTPMIPRKEWFVPGQKSLPGSVLVGLGHGADRIKTLPGWSKPPTSRDFEGTPSQIARPHLAHQSLISHNLLLVAKSMPMTSMLPSCNRKRIRDRDTPRAF